MVKGDGGEFERKTLFLYRLLYARAVVSNLGLFHSVFTVTLWCRFRVPELPFYKKLRLRV